MFKQLLARVQDDDNPRLHRIPFFIIWIATYGLAWFGMFFLTMFITDIFDLYGETWLISPMIGVTFGMILAVIQGWIMRRRYGFIPRYWRIATIAGSVISAITVQAMTDRYFDIEEAYAVGIVWFSLLPIFQSLVLLRVNRQAWMVGSVGLLAGIVACVIEFFSVTNYSIFWAILLGAAIQAIGTGLAMMRLLANPREGVVPKRDIAEKAKTNLSQRMHPVTFIGFWASAYFMGYVTLFVMMALWFMTIGETEPMETLTRWLGNNAEWTFGVIWGTMIGFVAAVGQPWLMKQQSNIEVRHWVKLSTLGWALAGIGFWQYIDNYNHTTTESLIWLTVWFGVPALFQTVSLWRKMRGGWIWAGTGIVTAIVALVIHTQFGDSYNNTLYAVILGGVAHAIISGATFVLLVSQQQRATSDTRETVTA